MAEELTIAKPVLIKQTTAEAVALELTMEIRRFEVDPSETTAREYILKLYAECLHVVKYGQLKSTSPGS